MQTLIDTKEAIALAFADTGYFDPSGLSTAEIAAAEARYVLPVTGRPLYERMLDGGYSALREEYAAPAAAYAVRLLVQPMRDIHAGEGGTTGPYSGNYRRGGPTGPAHQSAGVAGPPVGPSGRPCGRLSRIRPPKRRDAPHLDRRRAGAPPLNDTIRSREKAADFFVPDGNSLSLR